MIKLGITGGIGSGKTTIAKAFEFLGVPVYNSDSRAKELMHSDYDLKTKLILNFGEQCYSEGRLNRKVLANIVFNDQQKLNLLNSIVHPVVASDFSNWCDLMARNGALIVLKEAALLIEAKSYKDLDMLILVTAPIKDRIKRIRKRDSSSLEEIKERIDKQLTDGEKKPLADIVLENDNKTPLLERIILLIEELQTKKTL